MSRWGTQHSLSGWAGCRCVASGRAGHRGLGGGRWHGCVQHWAQAGIGRSVRCGHSTGTRVQAPGTPGGIPLPPRTRSVVNAPERSCTGFQVDRDQRLALRPTLLAPSSILTAFRRPPGYWHPENYADQTPWLCELGHMLGVIPAFSEKWNPLSGEQVKHHLPLLREGEPGGESRSRSFWDRARSPQSERARSLGCSSPLVERLRVAPIGSIAASEPPTEGGE